MINVRPRPLPVIASFIIGVLAILGIALATAHATEEPTPPPAVAAVGSGSGSSSAALTTAQAFPDPVDSPAATIDTLKAAKAIGWACLVFAALTVLARVAGRLGKDVKWFAWLGKGKAAVLVGAVGALALATYNALALGGTLIAAALAGLVALAHYLDATPKDAEA